MNDESQPGNRSVETADYLAVSRFGANSDFSDDSDDADFEDTGSFYAGSLRFSSPETEFPPSPGSSDFSAAAEEPAESAFTTEPEPAAEPAAETTDTFGTFDSFEPTASFESDAASSEPEAFSSEPEAFAPEPEASAGTFTLPSTIKGKPRSYIARSSAISFTARTAATVRLAPAVPAFLATITAMV